MADNVHLCPLRHDPHKISGTFEKEKGRQKSCKTIKCTFALDYAPKNKAFLFNLFNLVTDPSPNHVSKLTK